MPRQVCFYYKVTCQLDAALSGNRFYIFQHRYRLLCWLCQLFTTKLWITCHHSWPIQHIRKKLGQGNACSVRRSLLSGVFRFDSHHSLFSSAGGNLSMGCISTGSHLNPTNQTHGSPTDAVRHAGDLGNIKSDDQGWANLNLTLNSTALTLFGDAFQTAIGWVEPHLTWRYNIFNHHVQKECNSYSLCEDFILFG